MRALGIQAGSFISGLAGAVVGVSLLGGTAYAATGGVFVLGKSNVETTTAILSNSKGSALSLVAKAGYAPFRVNTAVKVPNLNADKIDNLDSTAFLRSGGTAANSNALTGLTAAQIEAAARANVDAATLGGQTSAQIEATARTSVDAVTLGGQTTAQIESDARTNVDAATLGGQTATDIITAATTKSALCSGYPHQSIDWSVPGSTPGNGCNLTGAYLAHAMFDNATLTNANMTNADLTSADFYKATMTGANLAFTRMVGANLGSSLLIGTNLHGADLTSADLSYANLAGADLSLSTMTSATVTGAAWSNTTCPDLTNSDADGNTCVGHGV